MLPDEKRIKGVHVAEYAKLLSSSPEAYQKRFSARLSKGLKPEELSTHFEQVKAKITTSLKTSPQTEKTESEFGEEEETTETEDDQ
jgi:hypothetical protein